MTDALMSESMSPGLLKVVARAKTEPEGRFHSLANAELPTANVERVVQSLGARWFLNPHFHLLAVDGVFSTNVDDAAVLTPTRAPAHSELGEVSERVHKRVLRMLRRRGLLREESDDHHEAREPEPIEACAQLSLRLGKLGHVDARGVVIEPDADEARFGQRGRNLRSGEHEGWSVHAGVTVEQGDADGRERLCRYVLRHPLSLQRLSWTKDIINSYFLGDGTNVCYGITGSTARLVAG